MSKIIASAAIRGAHKIVGQAEEAYKKALDKFGADKKIEFPNTGYFLPVIYAMSGMKVEKIADIQAVLAEAKRLLPPEPDDKVWLPYLGHALDAGMATLYTDEIIEVLKYLEKPVPYTMTVNVDREGLWLGAANDVIMRERGIEFVDGSAPGFAACVGAAPDSKTAAKIARELQEKNLYVFLSADTDGKSMAEQLHEEGVQLGWETRLVPFGKDVTATVFALGFAVRAAMAFGGVQPGDFRRNLMYNKNRIFAFVLALGEVSDEKYAQAAGAINFGFPVIADTDIPQILPTGVCTYEHVVSKVPHDEMVQKAVEVRGLKVKVTKVPVPVPFGPAFEGERIRRDDMYVEATGNKKPAFEWLTTKDSKEVEDGKVEVIGKDIDKLEIEPSKTIISLGVIVEVAGRKMESDFEPIVERQFHTMLNCASGLFHMGQRDLIRVRISKTAFEKGLRLEHIGKILHAKIHDEFGSIVDKVQVKIITNEKETEKWRQKARDVFHHRDERLKDLTDEKVDTFYSCLLCQSFAPTHVCVITPQRPGLCGAFNWLDGKAAHEIDPTGGHRPIPKKTLVDEKVGQWQEANDYVKEASRGKIERMSAYSMIVDPMTSCFAANTKLIIDNKPSNIGNFVDSHFGDGSHQEHAVLNLKNGKVSNDKVIAIQRFKAPGKLIKIKTKTGVEFTATANHEICLDRPEGIVWVRAVDIKKGDRIISVKRIDIENSKPAIRFPEEIKLPNKFQFSKDLFYLAGLIASDGSISKRGRYEYRFDFINTEKALVDNFVAIYKKIFPKMTISVRVKEKASAFINNRIVKSIKDCCQVHFNNSAFGYICQELGIQIGSKGKWNLGKMLNLKEEYVASFLTGLFDGDGSVRLRKYNDRWNTAEAYICINKKEAALDIQLLLKRLSIVGNVRKSKSVYKVVINGSNCRKFAALNTKHPKKAAIFKKIMSLNVCMDNSQEQVLPYEAARIMALMPQSKEVFSSSTLSYYRNAKSRPVASNATKLIEASRDCDNRLKTYLGVDYFLDIVTDVKRLKNHKENFVYNITLKDNHTYVVNGGPLVKNCGCFECIACILPMTNGIMIVDREYGGMTPCGMKFSTLAGTVGGGAQTPGFVGHSRLYIVSEKFISADGGLKRLVWMPKSLKEMLKDQLGARTKAIGEPDLLDKIADETIAETEEEVLKYITEKNHPVLKMDPML